jgi:hypothetical protein
VTEQGCLVQEKYPSWEEFLIQNQHSAGRDRTKAAGELSAKTNFPLSDTSIRTPVPHHPIMPVHLNRLDYLLLPNVEGNAKEKNFEASAIRLVERKSLALCLEAAVGAD